VGDSSTENDATWTRGDMGSAAGRLRMGRVNAARAGERRMDDIVYGLLEEILDKLLFFISLSW